MPNTQGGRPVDVQQVKLIGDSSSRARVTTEARPAAGVEDARDVVERLAPQTLVYERGPLAVAPEREQAARAAFAHRSRRHHQRAQADR